MKRALLLTMALTAVAGMAFAGPGSIGIFADPAGASCNFTDLPTLTSFYVVHVFSDGATGCQYKAARPACYPGSYIADQNQFPVVVGTSQNGISVGYGVCKVSPIHVQTILYFGTGLTGPCCYYPITEDPNAVPPGIYVVDCSDNLLNATGGKGIINPQPNCNCNVPVEDTTWGQVKALYTD